MDLNDDCLSEIFKHLTLGALANVASTCTRFQIIARDIFSRRYKSKSVELYLLNGNIIVRQLAAICRHFSDLITILDLNVHYTCKHLKTVKLWGILAKYCIGLKRLKLSNIDHLPKDYVVDAMALFRNVKELVLYKSSGIDGSLLSEMKKLTRLELRGLDNSWEISSFLSNDYPQLQSLILNMPDNRNNRRPAPGDLVIDMNDFLLRHPNLIELNLHESDRYNLSSISDCLWLRKLSIRDTALGRNNIPAVALLNNLSSLQVATENCGYSLLLELLLALRSTETLEELIISGDFHDGPKVITNALKRFTKLKYLSVSVLFSAPGRYTQSFITTCHTNTINAFLRYISSDGLVDLVRTLPHLKQLALYSEPAFDYRIQLQQSTYLRICGICGKRNQKLVISNYDVSQNMKDNKQFAGLGDDQHEFVKLDYCVIGNSSVLYV